jgi:hypothetical protein
MRAGRGRIMAQNKGFAYLTKLLLFIVVFAEADGGILFSLQRKCCFTFVFLTTFIASRFFSSL